MRGMPQGDVNMKEHHRRKHHRRIITEGIITDGIITLGTVRRVQHLFIHSRHECALMSDTRSTVIRSCRVPYCAAYSPVPIGSLVRSTPVNRHSFQLIELILFPTATLFGSRNQFSAQPASSNPLKAVHHASSLPPLYCSFASQNCLSLHPPSEPSFVREGIQ